MRRKKNAEGADWTDLCVEFATGSMTVAQLARDHGLPYKTVYNHSVKDKWDEERQRAHALYIRKTVNRVTNAEARHYTALMSAADRMSSQLNDALKKSGGELYVYNAGSDKETKGKQLNTAFAAQVIALIDRLTDVQNKLHGILPEETWQQIATERMAIAARERAAAQSAESGDGSGVIFLPQIAGDERDAGPNGQ